MEVYTDSKIMEVYLGSSFEMNCNSKVKSYGCMLSTPQNLSLYVGQLKTTSWDKNERIGIYFTPSANCFAMIQSAELKDHGLWKWSMIANDQQNSVIEEQIFFVKVFPYTQEEMFFHFTIKLIIIVIWYTLIYIALFFGVDRDKMRNFFLRTERSTT